MARYEKESSTLAELSQIIHQKQAFLKSRKELFSKPKADIRFPETPLSKRSKSSFLFFSQQYSTFTYLWAVQLAYCG